MVVLHSDSGCPPTLTSEGLDRQLTVQMKRKIILELVLEKNSSMRKKLWTSHIRRYGHSLRLDRWHHNTRKMSEIMNLMETGACGGVEQ